MPGIDATAALDTGVLDVTLKGPSLQGDLAVSGDIKCPSVSVGAPDLSLEAPEGGIKLPKMKLPQFGISAPGSGVDINVKGPQVTGELKGPGKEREPRRPEPERASDLWPSNLSARCGLELGRTKNKRQPWGQW